MSDGRARWFERPLARTIAVLAALAYLPALTTAPGRMPSDSKLYLYLDPGRFLGDAAATFDARQFAGWVPHQHVAYLWPAGPWFWVFEAIGVPDWIAHRLWIGTLMVAAGLGVRWCARLLGLGPLAAMVAAVVYQLALYVLPYVSRTSVMLLPWAGLGWIVAFTIRATRRRTWGDPAAIALVVLTVGAVNATALVMIVPAPVLWLVHSAWQGTIRRRQAALVAARVAILSSTVSLWWIVMLVVQGRHGTDVLPYSESLADVSLTATAPEVWRGLGYWLFYVRDPAAAATSESLRYLSSTPAIALSFLLPIACLAGLVVVRWSHRRFAILLVVTGIVLSVGVHPVDDRSPLMQLVAGNDEAGIALALRSSTRALPVMMLGLSLAVGSLVMASAALRLPRTRRSADRGVAALIGLLAVANLPALWTGGFVDPALERDQSPPAAWFDAAAALDELGAGGRVLQLPGQEFGSYRWGHTVDQPLPGLTHKPLITRDLLPLGSAAAMDLLYALDDRIQEGTLEPGSVAPVARLLGVDTIWVTNDIAFDRFRTARPEVVGELVAAAPGVGAARRFGEPFLNRPQIPITDERSLGDPGVGAPLVPVELYPLEQPGSVVRAASRSVVVAGSGDGLVDLAAAGLLDGSAVVRYAASLDDAQLEAALEASAGVLVTDSNRDRARHWRSSQDTTGYTEPGGVKPDLLRPVAADRRLPVFGTAEPASQTIAVQRGPVTATATSYGEPFAYLPEHRAYMAIDGDPETAWIVGEHGDPIGESIRLDFDGSTTAGALTLHQASRPGARRITTVIVTTRGADGAFAEQAVSLDDRSVAPIGQRIELPTATTQVDLAVAAVGGGVPATAGAVAGVGFTEIETGLAPTIEVVRPPHDALDRVDPETPLAIALTRLRSDPMDRWRRDPEPTLLREFELPSARRMETSVTVRVDARAPDAVLAGLFDWPVIASARLTGSLRSVGAAAFDGDPATAWITPFDGAVGATVAVADVATPVDLITVRQPVTGFSRVTALTVAGDGASQTVDLVPDAAGGATATLEPPLPAGTISITIAAIDPATTIDRRHADPVVLPAAITEFTFAGAPRIPLESASAAVECAPLATIDGAPLLVSFSVDDWLAGAPVTATTCASAVDLGGGTHVVGSAVTGLGVTVDRVVLRSGFGEPAGATDREIPTATVTERGRFHRTVEVADCRAGCWLVVGEGFSEAWRASVDGASLGPPDLVDGGFNGWWLEAASAPIVVDVRWTAQRALTAALLVSLLGALAAAALVIVDRRRNPAADVTTVAPRVDDFECRPSDRSVLVTAIAWVIAPAVLIGPSWAVWGALAGAAVALTRRPRLAELSAWATVIVVGGGVTFLERRDAPLPDGGWPTTFESLHGAGMFAMVCLLVAALTADDADLSGEAEPPGADGS